VEFTRTQTSVDGYHWTTIIHSSGTLLLCMVHVRSSFYCCPLQPSDWYSVTKIAIETQNKKAKKLWRIYSSLEEALRDLYPEYPWDPLQFERLRHDKDSLLQLIIKAEQQLGIQQVNHQCLLSKIYLPHAFFPPPPSLRSLSGIRLVFHHPCRPEEHWSTINTPQSGTCRIPSRTIS